MNTFYLVWREGGGAPTFKHDSFESAREEAERLARAAKGDRFFVLMTLGSAISNDVHWEFSEPQDNPLPF